MAHLITPLLLQLDLTLGRLGDLLRTAADRVDELVAESARLRAAPPPQPEPTFHLTTFGSTAFVHAVDLLGDRPELAEIRWDFGDPAPHADHNTLGGFNAAHDFATPGDHTITLTITADGETRTYRRDVTIIADHRPLTEVPDGGDLHAAAADGGRIGLRRGASYDLDRPLPLTGGMSLEATGDGEPPLIRYTGPVNKSGVFPIAGGVVNVRLDGLSITTGRSDEPDRHERPTLLTPAGRGVTVRRCTFDGFDSILNAERRPNGVLVQGCQVPGETGLAGYFTWGAGSDLVLLGNVVANSTREHVVRLGGGADRTLIAGNTFTNADRRDVDPADYSKSSVTMQLGTYGWAEGNTLVGPASVGPLHGADGLKVRADRFRFAVYKGNTVSDPQRRQAMEVRHGASNVRLTGNTIHATDHDAIQLDGHAPAFGRGNAHVLIDANTATNAGKHGSFLRVLADAEDVTVRGNTYVAPSLEPGSHETAVVTMTLTDPSTFTFEANDWPDVGGRNRWVPGGAFYVARTWSEPGGYLTAERFDRATGTAGVNPSALR